MQFEMENLNGTLSCLYDSVIQRELIGHGNDKEKYTKMLGIMRFDFLMMGTIVITDAMWYDGTIFKSMHETSCGTKTDLDEFATFLKRETNGTQSPLRVMRRKNYGDTFSGRLYFSSIDDDNLRKIMGTTPDNKSGDNGVAYPKPFENKLTARVKMIESRLQSPPLGEEEREKSKKELELFEERMMKLDLLASNGLAPDEDSFSVTDEDKEGMRKVFDRTLTRFIEHYQKIGVKDERLNKMQNELENMMSRSKLISMVNELKGYALWDLVFSDFLQKFLEEYNDEIARQRKVHFCKDNMRYAEPYVSDSLEKGADPLKEDGLLRKILDELKDMTWKDFGDLYYCEKLIKLRKDWIDAWGSQDKSTSAASCKLANYLNLLITKLPKSYKGVLEHSVFYEKEEHLLVANGSLKDGQVVVGQDATGRDKSIEPERLVMFTADEDENKNKECGIKIDKNTCHPSDLDRSSDSEFFKEFISHVRFGKSEGVSQSDTSV